MKQLEHRGEEIHIVIHLRKVSIMWSVATKQYADHTFVNTYIWETKPRYPYNEKESRIYKMYLKSARQL